MAHLGTPHKTQKRAGDVKARQGLKRAFSMLNRGVEKASPAC